MMQLLPHPAFTAADVAQMSRSEQMFFTDAPNAHAVAFEDFERARRIDQRNADIVARHLAAKRAA